MKKSLAIVFFVLVVVSAIYALRDRRPVTTSSGKALAAYNEAEALRGKLYFKEAIEKYRTAIGYDSTFAMAYARLALLTSTFLNKKDEAQRLIEKASSLTNRVKEREKMIIAITKADIDGDTENSEKLKDQFVTKYPNLFDSHLYQAERYRVAQDWDNAIKEYEKIREIDPDYALSYNMLAYFHYYKREYDEAVEYVRKYAEIAQGQANPHDSYGEILMNIGKYDEAIAQFNIANKIKPDLYFVLLHLGDAHAYIGRIRDAQGYYQRARDFTPGDNQKLLCDRSMGRAYWIANMFPKAISVYEGISSRAPHAVPVLLDLGSIYAQSGNLPKAESLMAEVRRLIGEKKATLMGDNPSLEYQEYGFGLSMLEALVACEKKDFDTAIVKLQMLVEQTPLPGKIWLRYFLGQCYFKKGDLVRARDAYLTNFGDNPNHAHTLLALADVYEALRQPEQQKETLLRYLSVMSGADEEVPGVIAARKKLNKLISS